MERSNWVDARGPADVADNVRGALDNRPQRRVHQVDASSAHDAGLTTYEHYPVQDSTDPCRSPYLTDDGLGSGQTR